MAVSPRVLMRFFMPVFGSKKSDFLEKSDFSPQEIRFFGKIGFLTSKRNPIFWKNRISHLAALLREIFINGTVLANGISHDPNSLR
jgi:hypothetical protein